VYICVQQASIFQAKQESATVTEQEIKQTIESLGVDERKRIGKSLVRREVNGLYTVDDERGRATALTLAQAVLEVQP
jgi:predicted transcriptional regulator